MANTPMKQDRDLIGEPLTFKLIFALGFTVVLTIALVGLLTGMRWRSWLPGAESSQSLFGGVQAAVYSFMSHTL
jgi:light-harvesting complex 1 beta chain